MRQSIALMEASFGNAPLSADALEYNTVAWPNPHLGRRAAQRRCVDKPCHGLPNPATISLICYLASCPRGFRPLISATASVRAVPSRGPAGIPGAVSGNALGPPQRLL